MYEPVKLTHLKMILLNTIPDYISVITVGGTEFACDRSISTFSENERE